MATTVYLNYEDLKNRLNLAKETENDDRITVLFCNNIVNSIVNSKGIEVSAHNKACVEQLVMNIFLKVKKMEDIKNGQSQMSEVQMMDLFEAVEETVSLL